MKQSEFLEIIELNKGKHRQPIEVLVLGRKNKLFNSEKLVETRIVGTFNVTDTSQPTSILCKTSGFTEIEIDGVKQSSVVTNYQFNTTGEHTVKYILKDETSISNNAFYGCSSLTNVTMPNSVTSIDINAFAGCTGLTSVTIPNSVTSIGNNAFQNCSALTNITIPNSVTSIGNAAFQSNTSALKVLNYNATCLLSGSFKGNWSNLETVIIGNSTPSLGNNIFLNCTSLTNVTIGSSVTSIGQYAFQNCSNLSTITSYITNAPSVNAGTFGNIKNDGTLYVPIGSSGYETWMNNQNNLGSYNWTKVEQ